MLSTAIFLEFLLSKVNLSPSAIGLPLSKAFVMSFIAFSPIPALTIFFGFSKVFGFAGGLACDFFSPI